MKFVRGRAAAFAITGLFICNGSLGAEPASQGDVASELVQLKTQLSQQGALLEQQDRRLKGQEAELAQLRQAQNESWLNERRAEEVKTLIREVLADSDTRASLAEGAILAGHDGRGFFITDADNNFLLTIKGMLQVRYTHSEQEDAPPLAGEASGDDSRGGFGITRSRFGFMGHVIDPSLRYIFWAGYDCNGNAVILDAAMTKDLGAGWSVTGGQFKLPFQYEYMVSETRLQFIDRTLIAGEFCGTYTQGVVLTYQNDYLRAIGSFNDGASRINTIWHTRDTDFAITGRVEFKLMGDWKDYIDWQGWPEQNPLLIVAGAVHYQDGEHGTIDTEVEDFRWTLDASLELSGFNIFGAVVGQHLSNGVEADLISAMVQGGIFITPKAELIGRYEWADSDVPGEDPLNLLTVGVNYYFAGHALKLSTDVGYAFDSIGATFASNPLGWRLDAPGHDGQWVFRSQMQLLF
jgi:hypothetical protein